MFFSTVIEIIASVFIVYGIYASAKYLLFYVVYESKIRKSVTIAVRIKNTDTEEDVRLKLMCAKHLASELTPTKDVYIIEEKVEDGKQ